MEENKRVTTKDIIIKSCRLFVQTMEGATSELHDSIISKMEGLTKTDERKCKLFLQKSSKCCREVVNAADQLLRSYVDEELTSDYDAEISEHDFTPEVQIKQEKQSSEVFFTESLGSQYAKNTTSNGNSDTEQSLLFDLQNMKTVNTEGDNTKNNENEYTKPKPTVTKASASSRKRKGEPKKFRRPKKADTWEEETEDEHDLKRRKERRTGRPTRKEWPCDKCDIIFKTRTLLRNHLEQDHGIHQKTNRKKQENAPEETEKQYECELCAKTFRLYRDYFRHRKFTHPDHFYKHGGLEEEANMGVKQVDISNIRVDKDNIISLVPTPDIKPDAAVRSNEAEKLEDIPKPVDNEPLVCDVCGKTCKSKALLKLHMKIHAMAYQCATCSKRFATRSQLTYHERIHTGETPHKCDVCNMEFRYSTLLNTHMFTFHCTVKPYQCDQCSESFRFKKTLGVHMVRKHSNVRPYGCSICGKQFVEKVYYRLHMKQHAGVRDYKCDQCDASFCTNPGLSKHKRMVHSEKHIVCHVCAKAFSHQSRLNSHMRVHSDEKKYSCDTCGKKFAWGHLLKQHMRTHTGEKPYQCQICQRQFLCSGNLTKHRKTHR